MIDKGTGVIRENRSGNDSELDWRSLNAMINLLDENGHLQLHKDKESVRSYFLEHVNLNTVFFHDLEEKYDYLVSHGLWDKAVFEQYNWQFVKGLFKRAYGYKFRFPGLLSAYKFYSTYALKTSDGSKYLERYEDRVVCNALFLSEGDENRAINTLDVIMKGQYQPATPTFLNAGKKQRGEFISCFLISGVTDNMEAIARAVTDGLQLSRRGGGVAFCLSNLRESGAPIKGIKGASRGPVPVAKMIETAISYADQLGQRKGAGVVYISVLHPDCQALLDTRRENADEAVRLKTLNMGVCLPDILFELARDNKELYMFSPYDVERFYGKPFTEVATTENYWKLVEDDRVAKSKMPARKVFQNLAQIMTESGGPFIMFEDTVNRENPIRGKNRIAMSNLCSEVIQSPTFSTFSIDGTLDNVGEDVVCNLGSLIINNAFYADDFGKLVETAMRSLSSVSRQSNVDCSPTMAKGKDLNHAVGLGVMGLHSLFVRNGMLYGDDESVDLTGMIFCAMNYYTLLASAKEARERGETFDGFEHSTYADGSFFDKYLDRDWLPRTAKVESLIDSTPGFVLPTRDDWAALKELVMADGLYHAYRLAVAPTGSISYFAGGGTSPSIQPAPRAIEGRKEGKIGKMFHAFPYLSEDNFHLYKDGYSLGTEAIVRVVAAAQPHVDQAISTTLFYQEEVSSSKHITRAIMNAWRSGLKTLYYHRVRAKLVSGTAIGGTVDDKIVECEACVL